MKSALSRSIILVFWVLLPSCTTLLRESLQEQTEVSRPSKMSVLWQRCPLKKSWDGGGEVRWKGALNTPPGVQFDWLYEPPELAVELSDMMGATLLSFRVQQNRVLQQRVGKDFFLAKKAPRFRVSVHQGYVHFYGRSTGLTVEEWGCLLAFALPSSWTHLPASLKVGKNKEKLWLEDATREIRAVLNLGSSPVFCTEVKWWSYWGLVSHRARVCFEGEFLSPRSEKVHPSLKWSYRSSDGWSMHLKPQ